MPRLPTDAFDRFLALGPVRSYARLAQVLGVSKRSVTARAARENWQERLAQVEREGRAKAEARLTESVAAVTERHLRTLRAVQHKALQALTSAPLGTASQAAATLIAAVRAERAIVAPGDSGAPAGGSLAELLERSRLVTDERVQEIAASLPSPPPVAPPADEPATPVAPPAVAARVFGEN